MSGPPSLARLSPHYAHSRALVALAVGTTTVAIAWRFCSWPVRLMVGWVGGGVAMLVMAWALIWVADAHLTHKRAATEDPGRHLVYGVVLLTSIASLFAAIRLTWAQRIAGTEVDARVLSLCVAVVVVSWLVTHTAFTLRYAHLYYRDDGEGVGGIDLPGNEPGSATYFDFAYFAFTIGMCFQVSDATISSQQVRRTTLMHALLSFAYNTAILALVLNLVFGSLLSPR